MRHPKNGQIAANLMYYYAQRQEVTMLDNRWNDNEGCIYEVQSGIEILFSELSGYSKLVFQDNE